MLKIFITYLEKFLEATIYVAQNIQGTNICSCFLNSGLFPKNFLMQATGLKSFSSNVHEVTKLHKFYPTNILYHNKLIMVIICFR